jgi:hypothetical protein
MDVRGSRGARLLFGCAISFVCLASAVAAFAQGQQTATLTGTVVDNVGVIPGATVTVTNPNTGETRSDVTGAEGTFRLVSLAPGTYTLRVNMDGFRQIEIASLQLQAGEVRNLTRENLTLTAGGVTETVNVTAEVTPVQTTSSALQKNLSGDLLTSVQVKGRDIFGMLKILPGVVDSSTSRDFAAWRSGRSLAINGGNSLNKNTTIDGVPVGEEGGNGTTYVTPNIDSVAEVNVISSGYTAENGRMASGQVVMVTKSGTNEFKGSAWYNGRRDWMNKNDFFRIKEGSEKPFFAVDMTGYSIGGPVILPGYNARTANKKIFWFASQEYTNDIQPSTVLRQNLPTAEMRAGDFTDTFRCPSSCTAQRNADGSFANTNGLQFVSLTNPLAGQGVTDFFCAPGTGGLSGVACAGTSASTNIINPKYFDSMGRSMLNLLPLPNFTWNQAAGQAYSANDARDNTNDHTRKNLVVRVDTVLSQNTRFSVRGVFDRDDNTAKNNIMPGVGTSDNIFPGNLISGTITQVIRPTVVNEITVGWAQNHWGFSRKPGPIEASDYTDWYRGANNPIVGVLPDPPRLAPFGPAREPALRNDNPDQYPYFPYTLFSGGNYASQAYIRPGGSSGPLPRWNQNYRYTLSDDLTVVRGRHSFKFGFFTERDSKTEPGSQDYVGSYNFGHNSANPLSTGIGYANALIGVFDSYTERNNRIDAEIRHWLTEAYAQDTWRVTPRFTLDYGLRISHNGGLYDARDYNSAFDPSLWDAGQAVSIYTPLCTTGAAGNASCSSSRQVAVDPFTGAQLNRAFIGRVVPGSGNLANGHFTGGMPGLKAGMYSKLQTPSWGPRVGFAWDLFGDGKTALRGATGVFYNLFNRSYYGFNGGPLISIQRQILQARISDIALVSGADNPGVTPQNIKVPQDLFPAGLLAGNMIAPTPIQAERHYQGNLALQRDLGFNTVVEVAWVGNFGRHYRTQKNINNVPINAYADPANLFNREAVSSNFIRRDFPGLGSVNYDTTDDVGLNYNSLQLSVQRRLSAGLQMGLAYTLAEANGIRNWDFMTEELFGEAGLRERYYGPQTTSDQGQQRRHVLVVNYSYQIPEIDKPVLRWILGGWEASGVTQWLTGDPINPSCGAGDPSGVANNDPSLSGVTSAPNNLRCEYVPGQSLLSGFDPNRGQGSLPVEDQAHFNVDALQRPLPFGTSFNANGIVAPGSTGNLGNVGWGVLRNPGWSNWDFTLARRLPVNIGRGGNVRLQLQFYNVFNQVQFNQMNASFNFQEANATGGFGGDNTTSDTGKYTRTQNPFNFGVTIRFDY